MAKAENNPQYTLKNVTVLYPRINRPYRYDAGERRSVPCDALDDGAEYSMKFKMDKATAKGLLEWMSEHYEAARKPNWPDLDNPFEKSDDGMFIYKTSLKAAYNGEKTKKPVQYDAKARPLPGDFELTTGSVANLAVSGIPYSARIGNGVSLRLRAVQVIELAQRREYSPFEAQDGFEYDSGNVFADETVATKRLAPAASFDDEGEDDVVKAEPTKRQAKPKAEADKKPTLAAALDGWLEDEEA